MQTQSTGLIALSDDELVCVSGGHDWNGIHLPDVNVNVNLAVNVNVNTQLNIINFIGNVIDAHGGDVLIQLGQGNQGN